MPTVARVLFLLAILAVTGFDSQKNAAARDRAAADELVQALAANDDTTANARVPFGEPPLGSRVQIVHTDPQTVASLGRQVDCGRDTGLPPDVTGRCFRYCLAGSLTIDGDPGAGLELTVTNGRVTGYAVGRC
jgi:hypothetical protein